MSFWYKFSLLFYVFSLLATEGPAEARFSKAAPPSWVKPCDFPLEPIPPKPSEVNYQLILVDTQDNFEEKVIYHHYVKRALSKIGADNLSQIQVHFDPAHYEVVFHTLRVYRDGKWVDRLDTSRHNIIQRESELERNIFNGTLTLVYFLDDLREGDLIEFAYSSIGANPLFSSHYADCLYMQQTSPAEKISRRLLAHPDRTFLTQGVHTNIEPLITDLSPSLREWAWVETNTPHYAPDPHEPDWFNPLARVELSEYKTWEEVVEKVLPLCALPTNFQETAPAEMRALTESWVNATDTPSERALLAIRFVQDQVRYLGFEEGIGGFKPSSPEVVFQRRFGDCKDKTFLLHALLRLMDISSSPVLVHSGRGKTLVDRLPTPFAFDHIVLRIDLEDQPYFVDSTIRLQGGSLKTNYFPEYNWGLVVKDQPNPLIRLPEIIFDTPAEVDLSYIVKTEDSAHLTVRSVFHHLQADAVRRYIARNGHQKTSDKSLKELQKFYGAVTANPICITDDRENNVITLTESYTIPTKELPDLKQIQIFSYALKHYLHNQVNPERSSPYSIAYPLWIKEHIHIESPFTTWSHFQKSYQKGHPSIFCSLSSDIRSHSADFYLEIKHLQDHVPQDCVRDYWTIVNDFERQAPFSMQVAPVSASSQAPAQVLFLGLPLMVPLLGLVAWFLYWLVAIKKRPTQDLLSFLISKFWHLYAPFIVAWMFCIRERPLEAGLLIVGIAICSKISFVKILTKRSILAISIWQGVVITHLLLAVVASLLLIQSQPIIPPVLLVVSILYGSFCLAVLKHAKKLLIAEKQIAQ